MPLLWLRTSFAKSLLAHVTLLALLTALGLSAAIWNASNSLLSSDAIEVQMTDVHVHHDEPQLQQKRVARTAPEVKTTLPTEGPSEAETEVESEGADRPESYTSLTPGNASASYLSQLSALIARHQFYPRAAILNAQEGIVKMKLSISATGELVELVILESSGHVVLDEAARTTLQRIKTYPLPEGLRQGIRLVVPIRYEINPSH
jgi:TonB family protein